MLKWVNMRYNNLPRPFGAPPEFAHCQLVWLCECARLRFHTPLFHRLMPLFQMKSLLFAHVQMIESQSVIVFFFIMRLLLFPVPDAFRFCFQLTLACFLCACLCAFAKIFNGNRMFTITV